MVPFMKSWAFDLCAGLSLVGLFIGFLWVSQEVKRGPKPRDYQSYCIDPFTSEDMGTITYTPCKLVPMWSMKL